jgi:methyltransferase (TIGR00027 family)
MVVRTALFDELIARAVERDGVDCVLNLAAGLDARPYRMPLPPSLRWIDVDLPAMIDYKRDVLARETPRCAVEYVALDLADGAARRAFFARVGARAKRVLVATEGLLVYLEREQAGELAADLHEQPSFRWWLIDIVSPFILELMQKTWGKQLDAAAAPLKFGPEEGPAFYAQFGWRVAEARATFEEAMQIDRLLERWGKGLGVSFFAPSRKDDERLREFWGRLQVQSASPHEAIAFMRMAFEIDVRHVAPSIAVPTLILHRIGDKVCHVENARWLARHIQGAKYVELPGENHIAFFDGDDILDEIREFLTGVREPAEPDRVLATVLFTDIVGSTERARELGDRGWRDLLERHNEIVRRDLERFRGREVDTAGDGFFATFDGPARAIRCGRAIVDDVRSAGLEVRAGLHTGEVELAGDAVRGIAVHTGARVAAQAGAGEVLVSQTVKDLVAGAGIEFEDRGARELKGIPGEWRLYAVR